MVAIRIAASGARLPDLLATYREQTKQIVQAGVEDGTEGMFQEFRGNLEQAFPTSRRARTLVTRKVFPDRTVSVNAAGSVVARGGKGSAWPLPLKAFEEGMTIRARGQGASMAIPTARVPRVHGRRMTPREVEDRFGEKLKFIPSEKGERGAGLLVLEGQTIGKSGRVRKATAGRARQGRVAEPVVFFILAPKVKLEKRLDFDGIAKRWAGVMPSLLDRAARRLNGNGRA